MNEENSGYIESLDGASGAMMFISATLTPVFFAIVYVVLILINYVVLPTLTRRIKEMFNYAG